MNLAALNLFVAWLLIPETVATRWVDGAGHLLLSLTGNDDLRHDAPARLLGAALLAVLVGAVWFWRGLPFMGDPAGKGYRSGHRLVLAANVLAGSLFVYSFVFASFHSHALTLLMSVLALISGFASMALWAIGFSITFNSSELARKAAVRSA